MKNNILLNNKKVHFYLGISYALFFLFVDAES